MVYLQRMDLASDQTWEGFNYVLTTQINITLGVMVACLPFLKSLLQKGQTNAMTSNQIYDEHSPQRTVAFMLKPKSMPNLPQTQPPAYSPIGSMRTVS